jgi:hypothetical protein
VDPEFGGSGMDATAAVIAHGLAITCKIFVHQSLFVHIL